MKKYIVLTSTLLFLLTGCGKEGADAEIDKATKVLEQGKTDEAVLMFTDIVNKYPDNKNASNFLIYAKNTKGMELIKKGDSALAELDYINAYKYYDEGMDLVLKKTKEMNTNYDKIKRKNKEQKELDSYTDWVRTRLQTNNELGNKWDEVKTDFALNRLTRPEFADAAAELLPLASENLRIIETKGYKISKSLGIAHTELATLNREAKDSLLEVIAAANMDIEDEEAVQNAISSSGEGLDNLKTGQSTFIQSLSAYAGSKELKFDVEQFN